MSGGALLLAQPLSLALATHLPKEAEEKQETRLALALLDSISVFLLRVSSQYADCPASWRNIVFHMVPRCHSPTSFNFPFRIVRTMMTDRMTTIDNTPTSRHRGPITRPGLFPVLKFSPFKKKKKILKIYIHILRKKIVYSI